MSYTKKLIGFFLVNTLVFYLFNILFPALLVFGNITISYWQAVMSAAFAVTVTHMLFEPIAEEINFLFHKKNWPLVFFFVNAGAIYIIARTTLSKAAGIGIAGFWVAIVLAIIVTAVQYVFVMAMTKK